MAKQHHEIRRFPVGTSVYQSTRIDKNGNIVPLSFIRTTLIMFDKDDNKSLKEISVFYGKNRTIEEALQLAMRRRIKFIKQNPEVFRLERNRKMLLKERNVVKKQ